jgi:poly(3-hydroxybutyrate) depolymerase
VWEAPVARLRDFSTEPEAAILPTLVLPPQAGHDSCIVDYSAEQSQMRAIVDAGLTRAFTLDWVGATPETSHASIDEYLAVVERAIEDIGGPVNLIGDCQGGWLATIYAALHPEQVNTLTIAGAPIDFHRGEPVIHAALQALSPQGDLAFYRGLVAAGDGVLKGEHMIAGFILLKPDNEVGKLTQLLAHVHEPEHVARFTEFENWFKHTQDIPGDFYLWIVEHLFRDNEMVLGELEVQGERVDLSRITCPVNLLGGATDHITPPLQVFALADAVATPEELVERRTAAGGHLGLFMGRESLTEHWPPLLAKVREHSVPNGKGS